MLLGTVKVLSDNCQLSATEGPGGMDWRGYMIEGHRQSDCHSEVKVKVHTLDVAPISSELSPQKRSGMARVPKGSNLSFTCTPTRSSAIGMSHTCICLPSRSWYSFTNPRGMQG